MSALHRARDRFARRVLGVDPADSRRSMESTKEIERQSVDIHRQLARALRRLGRLDSQLARVTAATAGTSDFQGNVVAHLAQIGGSVAAISGDVARLMAEVEVTRAELADTRREVGVLRTQAESLEARLDYLHARARAHAALVLEARRDLPALRTKLEEVRATPGYADVWDMEEPLISVRIATWNRPQALVEVAIASVLAQTYQHFEIVVVSDGPSEVNRAAVEGVGDPRIRYVETERKSELPPEPRNRYLVSGAAGMNVGARQASGVWIAPLDDDDEWTPDHLATLLALARAERAELVYGALIQRNLVVKQDQLIWADRPAYGRFSWQGAMYLRALGFFEYDEQSWLFDEPGDWELVDRMVAAGVTFATTPEIVGTLNTVPYTHKDAE